MDAAAKAQRLAEDARSTRLNTGHVRLCMYRQEPWNGPVGRPDFQGVKWADVGAIETEDDGTEPGQIWVIAKGREPALTGTKIDAMRCLLDDLSRAAQPLGIAGWDQLQPWQRGAYVLWEMSENAPQPLAGEAVRYWTKQGGLVVVAHSTDDETLGTGATGLPPNTLKEWPDVYGAIAEAAGMLAGGGRGEVEIDVASKTQAVYKPEGWTKSELVSAVKDRIGSWGNSTFDRIRARAGVKGSSQGIDKRYGIQDVRRLVEEVLGSEPKYQNREEIAAAWTELINAQKVNHH